jgi:Transposase DDE domain
VPLSAENDSSAEFFLPEFIHQFLPDRKSLESLLDTRFFSRARRLSLEITLALLLNMVRPGERVGYQKVIDRFFSETGLAFSPDQVIKPPDKAAFHRARQKIPVKVCQILFAEAVTYAQSLAGGHDKLTWNGFRVYAIDGTKKTLPASDELSDFFEAPSHAHFPQMITGVLFDVLAKLPLNYMRAPFNTPERDMALGLLKELGPGDLLLLDRGYPGYLMFQAVISQGADFLVRLPKNGLFQEVRAFLARGKRDGKITIFPPKKLLREHPNETYPPLTLRLVVVSLPGTATDAVFITTLLDSKKYPRRALKNLYHHRWSEEEFFKTIKEHLQAEEFHGKSVQFIDQELLSTYLYYVLTRILMLEAARQHDLPVGNLETKAALVAVARYLDRLWLAETLEQCQELLGRCLTEISWRTYQPRFGRKFPRLSKSRHGKWANKWA